VVAAFHRGGSGVSVVRSRRVLGKLSWRWAAACLTTCVACSKSPPPAPAVLVATSSASTVAGPALAALSLVTPTAFDLVPSRSGATLVFVDAAVKSAVRLEFDAGGAASGVPGTVLGALAMPGEPSDLAAAWVGERLALAWNERDAAKARVRAAWLRPDAVDTAAPARVMELGPAWVGPRTARGNVVVTARGDRALVFARGEQTACVDPTHEGCFGFSFHELHADRAVPTGLPLAVPVPCTDHSAALAVVGKRWHYGVCTDTGKAPMTTLFTIEHEPEYARADRLLEGCKPTGMLNFGGAAWLIGDCQGSRRAVRVGGRDEPLEYLELRTARLECGADGPRVRAPGLDLALDEPRGRLEALLPIDLVPVGARAVWSGRALLVAATGAGPLALNRYRCEAGRLLREGVPLPVLPR
jgi:hypothetical protein